MRRQRNHYCGYSNIDYRTKQDQVALSLFQPWKIAKSFGMLGQSSYRTPSPELKKFWDLSVNISLDKNIVAQSPDPKIYHSLMFYNKKKMTPKTRSFVTSDRVAQLEELQKGKEPYIGDSVLYSNTLKIRKERISRNKQLICNRKEELKKSFSINVMHFTNKGKVTENKDGTSPKDNNNVLNRLKLINSATDRMKLSKEELERNTLKDAIEHKRLIEIRNRIRERYMNKPSIVKAFRTWNENNLKEISIQEAHSAINHLGIPINYNETRALIIATNARHTESLNIEEFIDLIFSNSNQFLRGDLSKARYYSCNELKDPNILSSFKTISKDKGVLIAKPVDLSFIESYIRQKIPKLIFLLKNEGFDIKCPQSSVVKILKALAIPERYTLPHVITALCDKFPASNDNEKKSSNNDLDIQTFINYCLNKKESNVFFDFKDRRLLSIKENISRCQSNQLTEMKNLMHSMSEKVLVRNELINSINAKKEKDKDNKHIDLNKEKEINNCQPSKEFNMNLYKDQHLYKNQLKNSIDLISSLPSLYQLRAKTRYGANPPYQDTYKNFEPECNSGMYLNKRDRFLNNDKEITDKIIKERQDTIIKRNLNDKRRARLSLDFEKKKHNEDLLKEQSEILKMIKKSSRMYKYESQLN